MSHLPVLILVVYFAAALLLPLLSRLKRFSPGLVALAAIFLALLFSIASALYVWANGAYSYFLGGHAGAGIEIAVDWVAVLMHLTINLVGLLILVYSQGGIGSELQPDSLSAYYTIYLLALAALNGLVMAVDLFNLYIFTEICTITACALVTFKPEKQCLKAGLKYILLSALGSGLILLGIGLVYMVAGVLNIRALAEAIPHAFVCYPWNIYVAMSLFIVGFGIKSALFPLHVWLPDAHAFAATPSSAVHSGLIVKVFIIAVARIIFQAFGPNLIPAPEALMLLSTIGIFAGSVLALAQTDIKRMLAYSTVAQISYIFMGFALAVPAGIMGGLLHIVNHSLTKSMLFLAAGAIIYKTGIRKIDELRGIGFRMPLTMSIFSIGALSMVGIPGFCGFISKYYLAFGALQAGKPIYVAVILASSLLNAIYYLPIVVRAFLGNKEGKFTWDQLPWPMAAAMTVLAAFNLYIGILPGGLLRLVKLAAAVLLP